MAAFNLQQQHCPLLLLLLFCLQRAVRPFSTIKLLLDHSCRYAAAAALTYYPFMSVGAFKYFYLGKE